MSSEKAVEASANTTPWGLLKQPDKHEGARHGLRIWQTTTGREANRSSEAPETAAEVLNREGRNGRDGEPGEKRNLELLFFPPQT